MCLDSLKIPLIFFPSAEYCGEISLEECSAASVELLVPLIVLKISWEQALIQIKVEKLVKISRPSKSHKLDFLCKIDLKDAYFSKVSFRSLSRRKPFFSRNYFKQCKPSILKCLHGIKLLRGFKFIQGQFPLSFFFNSRILLRN